ncbi:hypothetical protein ASH01_11465 [Terrabacter sp. Soil811]|uniref:DUF4192 domain-containing protein n=1 Tax=Terrabacter sp. Soil811 TaxID=1736419 RepID=UPI0006FB1876|nr:DUF4192 domain-containing protein [Terrabacter sp. Soil811]KRF44603.1 hypothetical protein ASH01_11465 [Terrabacter sp. Soil811]
MTAPPVTLRSPAELLAVIPHLLGFEPRQSIVVVALRDSKMSLTQRMDLPDRGRVEEVAHALVGRILRDLATAALLVGYEDTAGESVALIEALTHRLNARGLSVRDRIVVRDGRWRSLDCDQPSCCPPQGSPLPGSTEAASAVAEFIGAGSAPLPDRQALAAQVEPTTAASDVDQLMKRGRTARTNLSSSEVQRQLAVVWARVLTIGGGPISAADAAVALQSLTDISTRDGIASLLIPHSLDHESLPEDTQTLLREITVIGAAHTNPEADLPVGATKARLIELCQHATDDHAAPALTLLATYSWWHGDGALARVAIDRALRCDPTYRLARLLCLMLDEGLRPERS